MPTMMTEERAIELMNDVLQRKMNSPASYVLQASPYVTEDDRPVLAEIEALAATTRRHAEEAARRILALEGVPFGGSYDPKVADANYLSVRYLLKQLIAWLGQDIALETRYRDACDVLEARDYFATVVEDDLAHRARLQAAKADLEARRPDRGTHLP